MKDIKWLIDYRTKDLTDTYMNWYTNTRFRFSLFKKVAWFDINYRDRCLNAIIDPVANEIYVRAGDRKRGRNMNFWIPKCH